MCATNIPGNERSLVIRLIAGDEDAFCELYAAYKNRLIYFAMRFLKSREYAEDIFQDTFTVIWESRRFINLWGIERSGFFNGQGKWAKGFENQMV